jgi:hypothetical protein
VITGVDAKLAIVCAGFGIEAEVDHEPDRAAFVVGPACRVLVLMKTAEWRRTDLYPRPHNSGLLPHQN